MKVVLLFAMLGAVPELVCSQDCFVHTKNRDCKNQPGCDWYWGQCNPIPTPPPSPAPQALPVTPAPTPSPSPGPQVTPSPSLAPQTSPATPAPTTPSSPATAPPTSGPGPTPDPASIDGICVCAKCTGGGGLEGEPCVESSDCGGFCASGDSIGNFCRSSDPDCPPNTGKPTQRGQCSQDQFDCSIVTCATRPTTYDDTKKYIPGSFDSGKMAYDKYGRAVQLSDGLGGRAIAYTGEKVQLYNSNGECSGFSQDVFHSAPDGAEVFPAPNEGWYYVSNSESDPGGVFTLEFDSNGNVVDYFPIAIGTARNCGGGQTPWGTWITCEENGSSGYVWQTDPSGSRDKEMTSVVDTGGNYEAFAYWIDSSNFPYFFTTNDSSDGPLVRFTPDATAMACYNSADKWCTLNSGSHDFLELIPDAGDNDAGGIRWGPKANANPNLYPYAEGIDVRGDRLYFISKTTQRLFIVDLVNMRYTRSSTKSGAFNNQPDQLGYILNDPNKILYFCEDGGSDCGVHGRDSDGKFFSILDGTGYNTETTGIAFSSDHNFMYLSFQFPGVIWQFWREDGKAFTDDILQIKYHEDVVVI